MDESGQLGPSVEPPLQQVLTDYWRRVAAGESISPSELISQNPSVAEALRLHFANVGDAGEGPLVSAGHIDFATQYVHLANRATIPPKGTDSTPDPLPEKFGRYRVVRCLGQGSMGAVYLAEDSQLDRPVALKIPKFQADEDHELIERFYREARAAALVRHPNLCPVYDAGQIDGTHYLAMAFLEGQPLSQFLSESGRPSPREAALIVRKLAGALDAAHKKGVIHRDLKPANIMIDPRQEPIVMDFGLARRMQKDDCRLTQNGLLMGSPAYMSPEQVEADADKMGPACDIYSLGVVLYELLTGEVPFRGSIAAVMGQIIGATPKPPSAINRKVDPALEAICLKMIAKRPEDRFASMETVAVALDAYLAGKPTGVSAPQDGGALPRAMHQPQAVRGVVIAPWMLWTAVAVVVGGFGITWQLIAVIMKQTAAEVIKIDPSDRAAVFDKKAQLVLNGEQVPAEQLSQPIPLRPGTNDVKLRANGSTKSLGTIDAPSGNEEPSFLVTTDDGLKRQSLPRVVAQWILSKGGKVKLAGGDEFLGKDSPLPEGKLDITQIDLSEVPRIPSVQVERIALLKRTLKRLTLPKKGISKKERERLSESLPDCQIESAEK